LNRPDQQNASKPSMPVATWFYSLKLGAILMVHIVNMNYQNCTKLQAVYDIVEHIVEINNNLSTSFIVIYFLCTGWPKK